MKTLFTAAALFATASIFAGPASAEDATAPAGLYVEDATHTYVIASYLHQGFSKPFIRWNDIDIDLTFDPADTSKSSVEVVIDAASVDSGVEKFDDHLKSADMFETEAYPEIKFVSTSLTQTDENTGTMTGDLTIKDTTRPITLDVTLNKIGETRDGKGKLGFSARGTLKRSDYGVDYAVPFVGDDVDLIIETELVQSE